MLLEHRVLLAGSVISWGVMRRYFCYKVLFVVVLLEGA